MDIISEIQKFWNFNPCGQNLINKESKYLIDNDQWEDFFISYDKYRYSTESHILDCLDEIPFNGKKVLEIGLGLGADSEQIIKRGGIWSGIDLTSESIEILKKRLNIHKLKYESVKQGSVLKLPWEDNTFDIIYSHGVLHHVPDILEAQKEIARVLKKDGKAHIMLYSKYSFNYLINIFFLRRGGLLFICLLNKIFGYTPKGKYAVHLENCKKMGLKNYLNMDNFIHKNTDGPSNPFTRVYNEKTVTEHFNQFKIISTKKRFFHAPPFRFSKKFNGNFLGWHLWVNLSPKQ